jgi:hypothetical protein
MSEENAIPENTTPAEEAAPEGTEESGLDSGEDSSDAPTVDQPAGFDTPAAPSSAFEPPEKGSKWLVFDLRAPGVSPGVPVTIGAPFNLSVTPGVPFQVSEDIVDSLVARIRHINPVEGETK